MEEWRRGWRTVLGAALAAATGVNLLYFVFSLFIPHLQKETGWTLGQFSQLQAIVGIGSLAAPLAGWAMDRYGCRKVWAAGMVAIALLYIVVGVAPVIPAMFGALVFATGLIGVATTSISYTRAVNSWFERQRGLALALSATGISLAAIFLPPVLERIITLEGWRTGYFMLAALALFIGLPSILFLVADPPPRKASSLEDHESLQTGPDSFWRSGTFWLIAVSYIGINMPASGMLSQMVPMMLEEGLTSAQAAFGISAFAAGQFFGRLACGWLLDRVNPQRTAFFFTLIPAIGCVLLWQTQNYYAAALFAVAAIGVQQGAEIDLLAYFVASRFGMDRYGTIYGWVQVAGWTGTLCGVLLFGKIHDWTGDYSLFQAGAVFSYVIAATGFLFIRLKPQRVFT
ncbi:MFS transporter [Sphingorhabdus pulchriflava]|uniref:MFS transporter n=1 Tax=Sphingorhabdus pulchriflava TaxID=2292257 RepID=A0A371B5W6_9SPHN|nr:MFS transporter [Sphingorhabdus pulchriflava]RDV02944.1 MFS transporter [Sphingorhabdus pulchriflava]